MLSPLVPLKVTLFSVMVISLLNVAVGLTVGIISQETV